MVGLSQEDDLDLSEGVMAVQGLSLVWLVMYKRPDVANQSGRGHPSEIVYIFLVKPVGGRLVTVFSFFFRKSPGGSKDVV